MIPGKPLKIKGIPGGSCMIRENGLRSNLWLLLSGRPLVRIQFGVPKTRQNLLILSGFICEKLDLTKACLHFLPIKRIKEKCRAEIRPALHCEEVPKGEA